MNAFRVAVGVSAGVSVASGVAARVAHGDGWDDRAKPLTLGAFAPLLAGGAAYVGAGTLFLLGKHPEKMTQVARVAGGAIWGGGMAALTMNAVAESTKAF